MTITSSATGAIATAAPHHGPLRLAIVGSGFFLVSIVLWVTKFVVYERVIFARLPASEETHTNNVGLRIATFARQHLAPISLREVVSERVDVETPRTDEIEERARHVLPETGCAR